MKYEKIEFEKALKQDWIVTNGIGGYSSSSILGINTRKYHGLLVAPLNPPENRCLILSKVDESFESGGKEYPIYSIRHHYSLYHLQSQKKATQSRTAPEIFLTQ